LSALSEQSSSRGSAWRSEWDWTLARLRCVREARRLLGDHEDADEAVQEAMARAWRGRRSCRTPEAPLPWLLQITRNEAMRVLRRRTERRAREEELPDQGPTEEPCGERIHQKIDLQRAIGTLHHEERLLIGLRYVDDMTQPDVARTLNQPEGTVKVRLHRVRERLREALEEPT
jgi:RNA polymerase sigma-70 factor, ECF subfamily